MCLGCSAVPQGSGEQLGCPRCERRRDPVPRAHGSFLPSFRPSVLPSASVTFHVRGSLSSCQDLHPVGVSVWNILLQLLVLYIRSQKQF